MYPDPLGSLYLITTPLYFPLFLDKKNNKSLKNDFKTHLNCAFLSSHVFFVHNSRERRPLYTLMFVIIRVNKTKKIQSNDKHYHHNLEATLERKFPIV